MNKREANEEAEDDEEVTAAIDLGKWKSKLGGMKGGMNKGGGKGGMGKGGMNKGGNGGKGKGGGKVKPKPKPTPEPKPSFEEECLEEEEETEEEECDGFNDGKFKGKNTVYGNKKNQLDKRDDGEEVTAAIDIGKWKSKLGGMKGGMNKGGMNKGGMGNGGKGGMNKGGKGGKQIEEECLEEEYPLKRKNVMNSITVKVMLAKVARVVKEEKVAKEVKVPFGKQSVTKMNLLLPSI